MYKAVQKGLGRKFNNMQMMRDFSCAKCFKTKGKKFVVFLSAGGGIGDEPRNQYSTAIQRLVMAIATRLREANKSPRQSNKPNLEKGKLHCAVILRWEVDGVVHKVPYRQFGD
jgi:hypothetical protein